MINTTAPSLLGNTPPQFSTADSAFAPHTLLDLMYDGFYALFMLKNRCAPNNETMFSDNVTQFLDDFDRKAKKMGASADDTHSAKYAYCAAVDEMILRSQFNIRSAWERRPLQLAIFGDQLAGENFFHRLEDLRAKGSKHIQALEVFHMCLLLGFEGKYIIEGSEKLNYLTARLGDEIALLKGKSAEFSPHWARPDQIINRLRNELPLWIIFSVFAFVGIAAYATLNCSLSNSTAAKMIAYQDVVKLAPRAANITITLP
jgi:type VI secretion system protein ImpK